MSQRKSRTRSPQNLLFQDESMKHRKKCLRPEVLKKLRGYLQKNWAFTSYVDLWHLPFEELERLGIEKNILTDRAVEAELESRRARQLFEKIGIIEK